MAVQSWDEWALWAARGLEAAGVAVIFLGALAAAVAFAIRFRRAGTLAGPYDALRADLGRAILLGLELLVGADIVNTVTLDATPTGVAVLGAIVLIRTFLSLTMELEISGRWPWQRPPKREG